MKVEQTECSETSAYKMQRPRNYPEENTTYRTRRKFEIKNSICKFLLFQFDFTLFYSHPYYSKFQLLRSDIILLFIDILELFFYLYIPFSVAVTFLPLHRYTYVQVFSFFNLIFLTCASQ
jgi:hypothetical protein